MKRVNRILHHPMYVTKLEQLQVLESDRVFCRHDLQHLLDVARLTWIEVLEQKLKVDREVVYAAALLHDIGRVEQIERGTPHDQASAELAATLLPDTGFGEDEVKEIIYAILAHRTDSAQNILGQLLYRADKRSRACWSCKARNQCKWAEEKKNSGVFR